MVDESTHRNWLVAVLRSDVAVRRVGHEPADGLEIDGESFTVLSDGGVSATFDRLMGTTGSVVGIQCWPVASLVSRVQAATASNPLVRALDDPPVLQVYFDSSAISDQVTSGGEQSLVGHLLVGSRGTLAVAVDLSELLSERELASLPV